MKQIAEAYLQIAEQYLQIAEALIAEAQIAEQIAEAYLH